MMKTTTSLVKTLTFGLMALAASLAASAASPLVHRYSFNDGTVNDSVGKAHGKTMGGVTIADGQAHFDGKAGSRIELPPSGADGINLNSYQAVTLEAWYTIESEEGWQRIFDFGATSGGQGSKYLFYTPHATFFNDSRAVITNKDRSGEAVVSASIVPSNKETHVAIVIDDKTMTLYVDGVQAAPPQTLDGQTLAQVATEFALLGASLYGADPAFHGSLNEFRIYNVAATAAQITASFKAGPNTVVIGADQ